MEAGAGEAIEPDLMDSPSAFKITAPYNSLKSKVSLGLKFLLHPFYSFIPEGWN